MLIANGWKLYCSHFSTILGLVLTISLPCQLLLNYLSFEVFSQDDLATNFEAALVLNCVFGIVLTGGILHALFVGKLERKASYPECLSSGITNWLQLGWTNFLVFVLVFLGSLAFILPGIILLIRLCLANTVVITEGEWGLSALKRSIQLTADRSWKIISLGLLVCFPLQTLAWLGAKMLLTLPTLNHWYFSAILGIGLELAGCLITTCLFSLYESFLAEESREV